MRRVVVPADAASSSMVRASGRRPSPLDKYNIYSCNIKPRHQMRHETIQTRRGASDGTESRCGGDHVRAGASGRGTTRTPCSMRSGVGAGALDPTGFELDLTTENSVGITQRVLPTFTTIVGQGGGGRASIGDFDPAMLVHGEQAIRLHGEIPTEGTVSITTKVAGMYDKGSAGLVVLESESRHAGSGELAFTNRTALFIRGAGGFGGPRNPEGDDESALAAEPLPTARARRGGDLRDADRSGAALPVERGPQPVALRPDLRQAGRVRPPDPARAVHLRVHRARPAPHRVRVRPGALRCHAGPLLQADHARRHPHGLGVGHRRPRRRAPTGSAPRPSAARR